MFSHFTINFIYMLYVSTKTRVQCLFSNLNFYDVGVRVLSFSAYTDEHKLLVIPLPYNLF